MKRCLSCMQPIDENAISCLHCKAKIPYTAKDVRDLPAGTVLQGRYLIGKALGRGGFGVTYIAYDEEAGKVYAIKEFFPTEFCQRIHAKELKIVSPDFVEKVAGQRSKFILEAQMLQEINKKNIKGVVNVKDVFHENETSYIVMEFLQGGTLDSFIEQQPQKIIPWEMAVDIVLSCLSILGEIHKQGILHRDISTSNIFMLPDGTIILIDFGTARYEAKQQKKPLTRIYKRQYSPPEQVKGEVQNPSTDLYALAIVLFKLIVGGTPPDASLAPLPPVSKMAKEQQVPQALDAILTKATKSIPAERYQDAQAFAQALRTCKKRPTARIKGRGIIVGALLAAAFVFGALLVANNVKRTQPQGTYARHGATSESIIAASPTPAPTQEPSLVFGQQEDSVSILQAALVQLGYLLPDQYTGKLDFNSIRALAQFALDNDCAFDADVVWQSFYNLVLSAAQEGALTATIRGNYPGLSEYQRTHLEGLVGEEILEGTPQEEPGIEPTVYEKIDAQMIPEPIRGKVSAVDTLVIVGRASANEVVDVFVNEKYYSSLVPGVTGDWFVEISGSAVNLDELNTIAIAYLRTQEYATTIAFEVDAECKPVEWANALDDSKYVWSGLAEPMATIVVRNGEASWQTQSASDGSFSLSLPKQSQGDTVHIVVTDEVGNIWSQEQVISRAERQQIRASNMPENAAFIAAHQLPLVLEGTAHAGDALRASVNGMALLVDADDMGAWNVTINSDMLKEGQSNAIEIAYMDVRDADKSLTWESIYDSQCEPITLLDALYPSSRRLRGVTEPNAQVSLRAQERAYEIAADELGNFELVFEPFSYDTQVEIVATDLAGNVAAQTLRVKEALPEVYGAFIRPYAQEKFGSDLIAVSAYVLALDEVETILAIKDAEGKEYTIRMDAEDTIAYTQEEFDAQAQVHKDDVVASNGYEIKKRITGSTYGIVEGSAEYEVILYALQGRERVLLDSKTIIVSHAEETIDDELARILGSHGQAEDEEEKNIFIHANGNYAVGMDEPEALHVPLAEFTLTGWLLAPKGAKVSMDIEIDGEMYSAAELRSVFGGTVNLARSYRDVEGVDGIAQFDIDNAGIIASIKLPRLGEGEHSITPTFIVSTPEGGIGRHTLKSYTLHFDSEAQHFRDVKEIIRVWENTEKMD